MRQDQRKFLSVSLQVSSPHCRHQVGLQNPGREHLKTDAMCQSWFENKATNQDSTACPKPPDHIIGCTCDARKRRYICCRCCLWLLLLQIQIITPSRCRAPGVLRNELRGTYTCQRITSSWSVATLQPLADYIRVLPTSLCATCDIQLPS